MPYSLQCRNTPEGRFCVMVTAPSNLAIALEAYQLNDQPLAFGLWEDRVFPSANLGQHITPETLADYTGCVLESLIAAYRRHQKKELRS